MSQLHTSKIIGIRGFLLGLSVTALTSLVGCASNQGVATLPQYNTQPPSVQHITAPAPGVVGFVWEEPMVDVIDVPPGLDPEGIYYRPAHQSIVEIRQGRWKYHRAQ